MKNNWYVLSADGRAMLCASKEDAEREVRDADIAWPRNAPHRAVQLVDEIHLASAIEKLRTLINLLGDCLKILRDDPTFYCDDHDSNEALEFLIERIEIAINSVRHEHLCY